MRRDEEEAPAVVDQRIALDAHTCADLLERDSVGRAAFTLDGRPHVQLVAYHREGGRLHLGAGAGSPLARLAPGELVAVQVDQLDPARLQGWSVVASGPASSGAPLGDGSRTVTVALDHGASELVGHWLGGVAPGLALLA